MDGLALGVLPEAAAALRGDPPVIALVHHPLALETGITAEAARICAKRARGARRGAPRHRHQPGDARVLVADYGVAGGRHHGRAAGQRPVAPMARRRRDGTVNLLAVGAVVPRKGYDILIEALARLADLDWRLVIAGDCARDRATADEIAAQIAAQRLRRARAHARARSAKRNSPALHGAADMFVLASRHEGYGMAFAEAIAHGLPVVGNQGRRHPGDGAAGRRNPGAAR